MEPNRSIEAINKETIILQEQINKLEQDKKALENELNMLKKELEASKDPEVAKSVVQENIQLKGEIEDMAKRLETNKGMMANVVRTFNDIKAATRLILNRDEIAELHKQGVSVYQIAQLSNVTQKSILEGLTETGKHQRREKAIQGNK